MQSYYLPGRPTERERERAHEPTGSAFGLMRPLKGATFPLSCLGMEPQIGNSTSFCPHASTQCLQIIRKPFPRAEINCFQRNSKIQRGNKDPAVEQFGSADQLDR